jgi:hypothetical protein
MSSGAPATDDHLPTPAAPPRPLDRFDDAYFKSAEKKQRKSGEKEFFADAEAKKALPAEYVENQKAVDAKLLAGLRWAGLRVGVGCGWVCLGIMQEMAELLAGLGLLWGLVLRGWAQIGWPGVDSVGRM